MIEISAEERSEYSRLAQYNEESREGVACNLIRRSKLSSAIAKAGKKN